MATPEGNKPMIKLHWLNGSRAQGILWLLEELQVPYELDIHHRKKDLTAPPELEKIHPLGKSPLVTITPPGEGQRPVVLAETAFITSYLCDHFAEGKTLVPKRWEEGMQGKFGGETQEWMRYQHLLYYAEGSLMPYFWLWLVISALKGPAVPFFIRPISSAIANRIMDFLVFPNLKQHMTFLEGLLETSPIGGAYLCGPHLTAGDICVAFPLLSSKNHLLGSGKWEKGTFQATFPKVFAYMEKLEAEAGWKRSAEKILEIEGKFSITPKPNM